MEAVTKYANFWFAILQYEVSVDAYERLSNTTDARGRKLEIFKLPRPPPMFRTYKEASGFKVRGRQGTELVFHLLLGKLNLTCHNCGEDTSLLKHWPCCLSR